MTTFKLVEYDFVGDQNHDCPTVVKALVVDSSIEGYVLFSSGAGENTDINGYLAFDKDMVFLGGHKTESDAYWTIVDGLKEGGSHWTIERDLDI